MKSADRSAGAPSVHCIGDSHVSLFSGRDVIVPVWPASSGDVLPRFKTYHLGPALAFNLARAGSSTQGRERLMEVLSQAVPAGDTVILSFGEIDCRAHLPRQVEARGLPLEQVVEDCLDEYFKAVAEVADMGFRVVVYNALCSISRLRAGTKRDDLDYVACGSWRMRAQSAALFNRGAKARCSRLDLAFLDTLPLLSDSRGRPLRWYYHDSVHLSQRAVPITLRELSKLVPDLGLQVPAVPSPGFSRRLTDWLDNRCRRLGKDLHKAIRRISNS